jgi:hypothetical protein
MNNLSNNMNSGNHGDGANATQDSAALTQRKTAIKERVRILRAKQQHQGQASEEEERNCSLSSRKERLASVHQRAMKQIQRSKALIAPSNSRLVTHDEEVRHAGEPSLVSNEKLNQETAFTADDDGEAAVPDSQSFQAKLEQLQDGLMRMKRENESVKQALDQFLWIPEDDTIDIEASASDAEEEVLKGDSTERSASPTNIAQIKGQARRVDLQRALSERHVGSVEILQNDMGRSPTMMQEDKQTDGRPAWLRSQSETRVNIFALQPEPLKTTPSLDPTDECFSPGEDMCVVGFPLSRSNVFERYPHGINDDGWRKSEFCVSSPLQISDSIFIQ